MLYIRHASQTKRKKITSLFATKPSRKVSDPNLARYNAACRCAVFVIVCVDTPVLPKNLSCRCSQGTQEPIYSCCQRARRILVLFLQHQPERAGRPAGGDALLMGLCRAPALQDCHLATGLQLHSQAERLPAGDAPPAKPAPHCTPQPSASLPPAHTPC